MLKLTKSSGLCLGGRLHVFNVAHNFVRVVCNGIVKDSAQCSASHVTGRRARTKKAKATKIENHAGDRNPTGERDRNQTSESGKSQKSIRSLLYITQVVSWERPRITDAFTKALITATKNNKKQGGQ